MAEKQPELQRGLEARHIELIALGGTIGVGLFMGSASTLKWAGPSVLLAYIIAGLFVFFSSAVVLTHGAKHCAILFHLIQTGKKLAGDMFELVFLGVA